MGGNTSRQETLTEEQQSVLVVGGGNFGTCLADHLGDLGHSVTIWARDERVVAAINDRRENVKYMPGVQLSANVKATTVLVDAKLFDDTQVIIMAIPTQHMRSILESIQAVVKREHLLVFVSKGIEISSGLFPHEIAAQVLGNGMADRAAFLSGPSFAIEVVQRMPTAVTIASRSMKRSLAAASLFHAPHFRAYHSQDTIGLEVSGALKNVIAIASGICSGLGLGSNSQAALITRGLAEMTRLGTALGANPVTFSGLAGAGDLFMTCMSDKSRNFRVGYQLGKGKTLPEIIKALGSTAEGVPTTKAAFELASRLGVDAPVTTEMFQILYRGKGIQEALQDLIERERSAELFGILE